jgi:hypothetical protein
MAETFSPKNTRVRPWINLANPSETPFGIQVKHPSRGWSGLTINNKPAIFPTREEALRVRRSLYRKPLRLTRAEVSIFSLLKTSNADC